MAQTDLLASLQRVLAIGGVARLFCKNFVRFSTSVSDFEQGWRLLLEFTLSATVLGSEEVAKAGITALAELLHQCFSGGGQAASPAARPLWAAIWECYTDIVDLVTGVKALRASILRTAKQSELGERATLLLVQVQQLSTATAVNCQNCQLPVSTPLVQYSGSSD